MNLEQFKNELNDFISLVGDYALIKETTIENIDQDEESISADLKVNCGDYGAYFVPVKTIENISEIAVYHPDCEPRKVLNEEDFYAYLWIEAITHLNPLLKDMLDSCSDNCALRAVRDACKYLDHPIKDKDGCYCRKVKGKQE